MVSKTPQFDEAINEILKNLVPETRTCIWSGLHQYCKGNFEVEQEDIEFLKFFKVPPPLYCPPCRRMRRFVYMNTTRLFKRVCNAPGHSEQMISAFPSECPFDVVDYKYYMSEAFDPLSFGVVYNNNKSVLDQIFDLRKRIPVPSLLNRDPSSVNSDYSMGGRDSKNCYFTSGCYSVEDAWYSGMVSNSREIMDGRAIRHCDTVYFSLASNHPGLQEIEYLQ